MALQYEKISPLKNLELLAKKTVEGFITGLHKSPFHGFSVEFAEHRLYNTGETTRHIDWKLFARTEKLFVKRYEEETNLRCQVVIDVSGSMLFPKDSANNKLNFSVHAAAALCELLKRQRDAYGITLFEKDIIGHLPAKNNPLHFQNCIHTLEQELAVRQPAHGTGAAKALNQVAEIIHQRSLVIIFSDMFENATGDEDLFSALQHLKYKKHEVVLFHVCDKSKEVEFNFENKPYRFVDLESGEEVKLNPNLVQKEYREAVSDFISQIQIRCGQYKIDFVEADINQGFDKVLMTYLVKRSRMIS